MNACGERRHRVADVQRAGDVRVVDDAAQLVQRRGRRERSDAQRVEEVGDRADRQLHPRRPAARLRRARAAYQKRQNAIPTAASKTNSAAFAVIACDSYPERGPSARYRVRSRSAPGSSRGRASRRYTGRQWLRGRVVPGHATGRRQGRARSRDRVEGARARAAGLRGADHSVRAQRRLRAGALQLGPAHRPARMGGQRAW